MVFKARPCSMSAIPRSSSPCSASAQPRWRRPLGHPERHSLLGRIGDQGFGLLAAFLRLAAEEPKPARVHQGESEAHRVSESASVLDGLAAHLERLVDATEAPQQHRAVRDRDDLRVVPVDQCRSAILGRVIERLAFVEVVQRRPRARRGRNASSRGRGEPGVAGGGLRSSRRSSGCARRARERDRARHV